MGVRYYVGKEDEFEIFDEHGNSAGTITGCILTISEKEEGRYLAMIDTGKEVQTVRLK